MIAIRSAIPAAVWMDDPNALMTAVELYEESDRQAEAEQRKTNRG